MQKNTAPTITTAIIGNTIKADIFGHLRPVVIAQEKGLEVYCKAATTTIVLDYAQLMRVPAFQAGVMAVLANESEVAQSELGI